MFKMCREASLSPNELKCVFLIYIRLRDFLKNMNIILTLGNIITVLSLKIVNVLNNLIESLLCTYIFLNISFAIH